MDLVICRWRSKKVVVVAILLRVKVSEKQWNSGRLGAWEFSRWRCPRRRRASGTTGCPQKEMRSQEGAQLFVALGRCSDFLLSPTIGLPARRVCCLFGMLLMKWNSG